MLQINQPAPEFSELTAYKKGEFVKTSLKDYLGHWLVLFFYPRDFTFICPTELRGFAKEEAALRSLGASVLAASTDSEWSHKAWFERDLPEVAYPVIADTSQRLAKAYGVLAEDGSAERGLFVIDDKGVLRYFVVSSGSVGRSVKETVRVLKALQSGELCPVDWDAGQPTLGKA